jgi:hypothetical protein
MRNSNIDQTVRTGRAESAEIVPVPVDSGTNPEFRCPDESEVLIGISDARVR